MIIFMHKVPMFLLNYTLDGKDFESDPVPVTFQPGQSHQTICVVIIDDDITEVFEKFCLLLSIPHSVKALGVWTGYPYYTDVVIRGMLCMYVLYMLTYYSTKSS